MNTGLVPFWLRRFVLVAAACVGVLAGVQLLRPGPPDYAGIATWSLLAAVLTASLNTWWAWRHGCRVR